MNLRAWLLKSLADHPDRDTGLVAYVEALVDGADGEVRSGVFVLVLRMVV